MAAADYKLDSAAIHRHEEEEAEESSDLRNSATPVCDQWEHRAPLWMQGMSKVRGQSGPRLKKAGGPSVAMLAPDPNSHVQNLVPKWEAFMYQREGVCAAHSGGTHLQHPQDCKEAVIRMLYGQTEKQSEQLFKTNKKVMMGTLNFFGIAINFRD